ncbi:DUF3726 domain-containing protein [Marivita geojedonensis]|uniref:DUF3726 domain-containing protein n=1 Tax=Marivita geojedonensis TaxID=1123756 RepID=A0A1X4NPJ4_9RHOB|nr:DUF3726 domain-containing protein [Marivita geojedonensis]OSQ52673.1 hypothetical protein MGEO_04765 [Marivita geojedonensis]PRY80886.1 uncharacterized protein DUF3726 [Marivita geojedonensis]
MTVSLNEVEAMAKKATRGAGYPWGVAEDAGKVARQLGMWGYDGCGTLARALTRFDGVLLEDRLPIFDGSDVQPKIGILCPLLAGTALSDHAERLSVGAMGTGPIAEPTLLLPFAGFAAQFLRSPVRVAGAGFSVTTNGEHVSVEGEIPDQASALTIERVATSVPCRERAYRAAPLQADWDVLARFAHRTYAPATEESRQKGAGADSASDDS